MIKIVSVLLGSVVLLTVYLCAQTGAPGCGDQNVKFEVKTEKTQHRAEVEPGKALLFFVEDDSTFESFRSRPHA